MVMMRPTLQPGQFIRMTDKAVWYVVRVSPSSAYIMPVTGKSRAITTRKGVTKMVVQRSQGQHIGPNSIVEILTPEEVSRLGRLKERIMGEATVKPAGRGHVYKRTEKEAKNMRGQGAIVLVALETLGQATIPEIVAATNGQYETRQPQERVVGFYISKFKREGLVEDITSEVKGDKNQEDAEREEAENEELEVEAEDEE